MDDDIVVSVGIDIDFDEVVSTAERPDRKFQLVGVDRRIHLVQGDPVGILVLDIAVVHAGRDVPVHNLVHLFQV